MSDQLTFPGMPGPPEGPGLPAGKPEISADRRRTIRQKLAVERGLHPLSLLWPGLKIAPDAAELDRRCGNCRFRRITNRGTASSFPKCWHPGTRSAEDYERLGPPRYSSSAASDIRAWWPGCIDHEFGDPKPLSNDAARYVPAAASE